MAVTYYDPPNGPAMTAVATVGPVRWENPFPEQSAKLVFRQRFSSGLTAWQPTTLNTPYPAAGSYGVPTADTYYLVAEDGFENQPGGLMQWDQVYACVPTVRYDYLAIPYRFPAIKGGVSLGSFSSINAGQVAPAGSGRMYVGFTGARPGDSIALSYALFVNSTTVNRINAVLVRDYAVAANSTTYGIIADADSDFISADASSRQVARASLSAGRDFPTDQLARGTIVYNYQLITPGVAPSFAFGSRQKFTLSPGGTEVDFVSADTSPSSVLYTTWAQTGTTFRSEDDQWERWLGNIYAIRSTYVAAQ